MPTSARTAGKILNRIRPILEHDFRNLHPHSAHLSHSLPRPSLRVLRSLYYLPENISHNTVSQTCRSCASDEIYTQGMKRTDSQAETGRQFSMSIRLCKLLFAAFQSQLSRSIPSHPSSLRLNSECSQNCRPAPHCLILSKSPLVLSLLILSFWNHMDHTRRHQKKTVLFHHSSDTS